MTADGWGLLAVLVLFAIGVGIGMFMGGSK